MRCIPNPVFLLLFSIFLPAALSAQLPYTEAIYQYRIDTAIIYGTAVNYAGNPVDLKLDLYKPVGDGNLIRPLIVLVHGGSWIGGTRDDNDIRALAPEFAKRGYVVASLTYRLGFHPSPAGGSNVATCPAVTAQSNCVYPADSTEIIRAIYRGMQDTKGAIRFLKARTELDSTCRENVYLSGVSAGGFCALAAAFIDSPEEKPAAAGLLPAAAASAVSLNYCQNYFNPPGFVVDLNRPDLGSIEGDLNQNGFSSDVKGIANFYGGMVTDYLALELGTPPLFYFFHQTTDVIVNCNYSPLLSSLSYDCLDPFGFLGCRHIWNMPRVFGSCGIRSLIETNAYPIETFDAIVSNGGPNCIADPAGHSILAPAQRVAEIATFFAPRIQSTEAFSCSLSTGLAQLSGNQILIYPNPAGEKVTLKSIESIAFVAVFDLSGRKLSAEIMQHGQETDLDLSRVDCGICFVHWTTRSGETGVCRIAKECR